MIKSIPSFIDALCNLQKKKKISNVQDNRCTNKEKYASPWEGHIVIISYQQGLLKALEATQFAH